MSPVLAGGFLTTVPPGKSPVIVNFIRKRQIPKEKAGKRTQVYHSKKYKGQMSKKKKNKKQPNLLNIKRNTN